ncbi:hypothetical protein EG68_02276 [Paragonimus skrjabini miyazakii]|uniref:Uncharacterized protein n=1 Tax=Paragonimus skrjabini miyazakii TaxID=59628 RepID=A0A8S9Z8W9_9TREM|nr:hypothetical protein EG68_02276 [Paragonimus skrjabini miyazakii]
MWLRGRHIDSDSFVIPVHVHFHELSEAWASLLGSLHLPPLKAVISMLASIASDHQLFRTQGSAQFEFAQTTGTERSSSIKLFQRVSTNPTLEIALCEEPDSNFIECVHIGEFSSSHLELIDCETTSQPGTIPTLPQTDYQLRTPWAVNQWEQMSNNQSMTLPGCVPSDQSVQNNHSPNMVYEGTNLSLRSRSSSPSTRQSDDLASLDDQFVRSLYTRQSELNAQLTCLNSELLHLVHEEWVRCFNGHVLKVCLSLNNVAALSDIPCQFEFTNQLSLLASLKNILCHSRSMLSSLYTRGKVESKTRSKPKTLNLHQPSHSTAGWAQTHKRSTGSSSQEDLATTPTTTGQNPSHENTVLSSRESGIVAKSQQFSSIRLHPHPTSSLSPQPNVPVTAMSPEITTDSTPIGLPDADRGETRLEWEESEIDISRAAAELKLRKLEVDFAVISQLHTVHKQKAAETKRDAYKIAYKANYRKLKEIIAEMEHLRKQLGKGSLDLLCCDAHFTAMKTIPSVRLRKTWRPLRNKARNWAISTLPRHSSRVCSPNLLSDSSWNDVSSPVTLDRYLKFKNTQTNEPPPSIASQSTSLSTSRASSVVFEGVSRNASVSHEGKRSVRSGRLSIQPLFHFFNHVRDPFKTTDKSEAVNNALPSADCTHKSHTLSHPSTGGSFFRRKSVMSTKTLQEVGGVLHKSPGNHDKSWETEDIHEMIPVPLQPSPHRPDRNKHAEAFWKRNVDVYAEPGSNQFGNKAFRVHSIRCLSSGCNKVDGGQLRRSTSDTSGMEQMFLDESSLQLNIGGSSRLTALRPYLPRAHSLPSLGKPTCSPNQLPECKNIPGDRRLQKETLKFPDRKSTRFFRMNSAQPVPRKSLESFSGTPLSNLRLYKHIPTNGSASFGTTTTAMHSVPPKQVTSTSYTSSSNWSTSGCSCLSSQTNGSTYLTDSKCDSSLRTTSSASLLPARLSLKCAQSAGEAPVSPLCTNADQSAVQRNCSVSVNFTQRVQLREAQDRGRRSVCTQDDKEVNCGEVHSESTRIKCICSCLSDKGALPNLVQCHPNAVEDWPISVTIPSEGDILDDEDEGVLSISDNEAEDGSSLSKAHRPKLINRCHASSLESCETTLTGSPLHTISSSPIGSLNNEFCTQATRKDKYRTARAGRMLEQCPPESSKNGKRSSLISFSLLRRAVSRVASSKRTAVCQFTKSSQPLSSPKVLPSLLTRKQIKLKCFADRQLPLDNITTTNDLHTTQPSSLSLQPYSSSSADVPSPSKLSWTQKLRYSARSTQWPNH